jgi:hypothetical protein
MKTAEENDETGSSGSSGQNSPEPIEKFNEGNPPPTSMTLEQFVAEIETRLQLTVYDV